MYYYVRIKRLNGRNAFYELATNLSKYGYGDNVEYFHVGWCDDMVDNSAPHLRFNNEGDAVAYCLTYGCTMSTTVPHNLTGEHYDL